jgi:peptide deformylase
MLEVVKYPDPRLRQTCRTVTEITEEMRQQARDMIETMLIKDGVGLAAIQVGLDYRMIVVRDMKSTAEEPQAMVLLNPTITSAEGEFEGEEGCLSLPGIYANVVRALNVKVKAMNLDGEDVEIEATEFYARVFQHEIDHLNGVLFIDKISPAKKIAIKPQLKRLTKEYDNKTAQDTP